jgi:hypothetical protein
MPTDLKYEIEYSHLRDYFGGRARLEFPSQSQPARNALENQSLAGWAPEHPAIMQ